MSIKLYSAAVGGMLSLLVLSGGVLTSCSGSGEKKEESKVDERPNVEIRKVHEQEVPQIVSYTATVEAYKTNNPQPYKVDTCRCGLESGQRPEGGSA